MSDILTDEFFTEEKISRLLVANQRAADDVLASFRDNYQEGRTHYANPKQDPCYNMLREHKKTAVSSLELLQKHVTSVDFDDSTASEAMEGFVAHLVQNWLNVCLLSTAPGYYELFSEIGENEVLDGDEELSVLRTTFDRVNTLLQSYYEARSQVFSEIPGLFSADYKVGMAIGDLRELSRGGDKAHVETKRSRIMTDGFGFSPFWGLASTSPEYVGRVVGVSRPPAVLLGDQKEMAWDAVVAICRDHDDGPHKEHHCYNTDTELWAAEADLRDLKQLAGQQVKEYADPQRSPTS